MRTEIWKIDRSTGYYKLHHRYLHRVVYAEEIGPIPKGWVVHHKDGDRENCVPENLEAMPRANHMAHHMAEQAHLLPERLSRASRARPLRDYVCGYCEMPFAGRGWAKPGPRFCSRRCRDLAWKARSS